MRSTKEIEISLKLQNKLFKGAVRGAKKELDDFNKEVKESESVLDKQKRALDESAKKFDKYSDGFTSFGKKAGVAFAGVSASIGLLLNQAGKMEQWNIQFTTMLGSSEKARFLLRDIKKFAAETPFELTGLVDSSKQLLAFGVASEDIVSSMKVLGDIAAGVGTEKLPTLINSFGKIKTKGKATMEELNMLLEAGVPILDQLAVNFGVSKEEMFKFISLGKVGFGDVNKALGQMTDEGGLFADLMKEQSKSFFGVISNIKDNLTQLFISLGMEALPTAKKFSSAIKNMTKGFQDLSPEMKSTIVKTLAITAGVTGLAAAAGLLGGVLLKTVSAIQLVRAAMVGLNLVFLSNPISLTISAVAASIVAIGVASGVTFKDLKEGFDSLLNDIRIFSRAVERAFSDLGGYLKDTQSDMQDINSNIKKVVKSVGGPVTDLKSSFKDLFNSMKKDSKDGSEKTSGYLNGLFKKASEDVNSFTALNKRELQAQLEDLKAAEKSKYEYSKSIQDELNKNLKTGLKDREKQTKDSQDRMFNLGASFVKDFSGTIQSLLDSIFTDPNQHIGKKISDHLSTLLGTAGSFAGGAIGQVISTGVGLIVSDVFKSIFGGKNSKSFSQLVEESFSKMVGNINRELSNIGKERSTLEMQFDVLSGLSNGLGVEAVIPEKYISRLGLEVGSTIKQGLVELLNLMKGTNAKEIKEIKEAILGAESSKKGAQNFLEIVRSIHEKPRNKTVEHAYNDAKSLIDQDTIKYMQENIVNISTENFERYKAGTANYDTRKAIESAINEFVRKRYRGQHDKKVMADIQASTNFISEMEKKLSETSDFTLSESLDNIQLTNEIADLLGSTPQFAVGAVNLPEDTLGMLHKNEMVVPAEFAQGLRSGELTLSGAGTQNQSQEMVVHNTNHINIDAGTMSPEELAQKIQPYLNGDVVKSDYGNYKGVFEG